MTIIELEIFQQEKWIVRGQKSAFRNQQLGRQVTCNRLGFQSPNGGPLATRGDGDMMHGFTGNQ